MNTSLILDVDGTIADSGEGLSVDNLEWLDKVSKICDVVAVGGGRDLRNRLNLGLFDLIFSEMGNVGHDVCGTEIWLAEEVKIEEEVIDRVIGECVYAGFAPSLDYRYNMINVSLSNDIEAFTRYEKENNTRYKICHELSTSFPDYQFMIGGKRSIDVCKVGKEQILPVVRDILHPDRVLFIGDRTGEFGNDHELALRVLGYSHNSAVVGLCNPKYTLHYLSLVM